MPSPATGPAGKSPPSAPDAQPVRILRRDDVQEYLSHLEPGVRGYLQVAPSADAESIRAHLAFARAVEILGVGPRKGARLPTPQYTLVRILFFADDNRLTQIGIGRQMGVTSSY